MNAEVKNMERFTLVLGEENSLLPGKHWTSYSVDVLDDKMVCHAKDSTTYEISYSDFQKAEFGIGSGNLWLQCLVKGEPLVFCSPRKSWKSEAGKKLIERIDSVSPIADKKEYDHYTGKLFWLYMFK